VRFDTDKLALFGHSMGATIAPLALAYEPRFKAAILSGSGGSFMANLLYKQKPVNVRPLTELALGYTWRLYSITQADPALSLVQWALEPADPPLYGNLTTSHVLMFQGIVDHYILPPMANAASLSLKLDLAGDELDQSSDELKRYTPFSEVAPLAGRTVRPYPVEANLRHADGSESTSAVVQSAGDGIQDGHEVVFQTESAKFQYRCFLSTFASGTPRIVAPKDSSELCGREVEAKAPAAARPEKATAAERPMHSAAATSN
jgi:pimeloyl-ACP methyl ester carboxylesterase